MPPIAANRCWCSSLRKFCSLSYPIITLCKGPLFPWCFLEDFFQWCFSKNYFQWCLLQKAAFQCCFFTKSHFCNDVFSKMPFASNAFPRHSLVQAGDTKTSGLSICWQTQCSGFTELWVLAALPCSVGKLVGLGPTWSPNVATKLSLSNRWDDVTL